MPDTQRKLATVTVNCACGRPLYTVSLNLVGITANFSCRCGEQYSLAGTLIPQCDDLAISTMSQPNRSAHTELHGK